MKKTTRDNWRVIAVLNPQRTRLSIGALGFTDTWGDALEGELWGKPIELEIHPKRLGDFGWVSMGDRLASTHIDRDYRERCETIRDGMRQHPNITEARIECDEEHHCSHCGCRWEELTAEDLDEWRQDKHTIVGEPLCCDAGINEFRTERNIPLLGVSR